MIAAIKVPAAGAKASASMKTSAAVKSSPTPVKSSAAVASTTLPKSWRWQQCKREGRDDQPKHSQQGRFLHYPSLPLNVRLPR
jgi:hypothetical protein